MTNTIDIKEIKNEFLNFLRNSDILSISVRGVTTVTNEEFSGNTVLTDFQLANANVKNVRDVSVGGVSQTYGTIYSVDYTTSPATIVFVAAPATGTNNILIDYDYGDGDKIFPDFPRPDLTISSYPRIGFDIISIESADVGFGNAIGSDIDIQVNIYATKPSDMETYYNTFRTAIIVNRDSFTYLSHIIPIGVGVDLVDPKGKNKILMKACNVRSILNYEVN